MISSRINNNFIINENAPLEEALKKIDLNKEKIVFVLFNNSSIAGTLSDGDIRRYLLKNSKNDINNVLCKDVMNRDFNYFNRDDNNISLSSMFKDGINCVPILDRKKRIVQIAFKNLEGFYIGKNEISNSSRVFTIAEVGNNHQGSIENAKTLVDLIKDSGADCAKFQMRNVKSLYKNKGSNNDESADLGAQYTLDLLSKYQLSNKGLFNIFD